MSRALSQTIELEVGELSFSARVAGPDDGELVLCLHGFPDGPGTYVHQFDALGAAGFRVVAPTMRGYEPSSQPSDGDYGVTTLADDVVGWLDAFGVERAHLVGHDWGAVVTYVVAAQSPQRLASAAALAIPPLSRIPDAVRKVPRQLQRSWYMTFFQIRGVAERAVRAGDWRLIRRLWADWSPDFELTDDEWSALRAMFEQPGVLESMLAYYRQNATPPVLLGVKDHPAMALTEIVVPTLILHGARDGCMDRRLFDHAVVAADFTGGVEVVELEEAGHFLHLEQPEQVNDLLLAHLDRSRISD